MMYSPDRLSTCVSTISMLIFDTNLVNYSFFTNSLLMDTTELIPENYLFLNFLDILTNSRCPLSPNYHTKLNS